MLFYHEDDRMDLKAATGTRFGGQSMSAAIRSVMVRKPAPPRSETVWKELGYLHPIDVDRSAEQHAAFRAILEGEGIEVVAAGPDSDGSTDAVFAYDPSFITDRGAILLRMGKEQRRIESAFHAATYRELGIPVIGEIEALGTVEGGDVLWLDEVTIAAGRGYRTNQAGIDQLTALFTPLGVKVLAYDLPHFHGAASCLHLMSMISPVDERLAVVYLPLMAVALVQELEMRGWSFVEVPDEEFDSMGCNVLALGPRRCLMVAGNPETKRRLEAAGCTVLEYEGDEISLNREGGPTCLTKPLLRSNA
jgi:N-dimethylarginine dimethylaminohydrolase